MSKVEKILHKLEKDLNLINPELFDWNIKYFNAHKKRYINDLVIIKKHYKKGALLEIGSLPCHMTYCLQKLSYPIIGVDINPKRSEKFIKKHNLKIFRCDIEKENLPFKNEHFEFVIFNEIFEHLRINPIVTLKEINRILKSNGILLLTTPNLYSIANIIKFNLGKGINDPYEEFKKIEKLGHMGHIREYSTKEMKKFLENTGFELKEIEYNSYDKLKQFPAHFLIECYLRFFTKQNFFQIIVAKKQNA